jgi:hypothetical protein
MFFFNEVHDWQAHMWRHVVWQRKETSRREGERNKDRMDKWKGFVKEYGERYKQFIHLVYCSAQMHLQLGETGVKRPVYDRIFVLPHCGRL